MSDVMLVLPIFVIKITPFFLKKRPPSFHFRSRRDLQRTASSGSLSYGPESPEYTMRPRALSNASSCGGRLSPMTSLRPRTLSNASSTGEIWICQNFRHITMTKHHFWPITYLLDKCYYMFFSNFRTSWSTNLKLSYLPIANFQPHWKTTIGRQPQWWPWGHQ